MTRDKEMARFAKHFGIPKREAVRLFVSHGSAPEGYRRVIEIDSNPKTVKGQAHGYLTGVIYLASADASGYEMCPKRTPDCTRLCLGPTSGHGAFGKTQEARVRKTLRWVEDTERFLEAAKHDVFRLMRKAAKRKLTPCVRANGTSDQPKLAWALADAFAVIPPERLPFYDYTKLPKPWLRTRANYSLTFSRSESNWADCVAALKHGVNVSAVFRDALPETFEGYRVIDGTAHDLRFLDERGVIVGLLAKGLAAKRDTANGFVILQ